MSRINELLTRTDLEKPLPASLVEALVKQYRGLESKKAELVHELENKTEEEEEDDVILYEIRTLIPRIVALWDCLPFEKRLRFVSALVQEVILNRASPCFLTMEIHWKMQDWETDIAYIRRGWSGSAWTPDDDMLLRAIFPIEDAGAILQAFPTRGWGAIKQRAAVLHLHRLRNGVNSIPVNNRYFLDLSWQDLAYAQEHNLALTTKNAQWWN